MIDYLIPVCLASISVNIMSIGLLLVLAKESDKITSNTMKRIHALEICMQRNKSKH